MITYGPRKKKKESKDGSEWPLKEKQELVAKHYFSFTFVGQGSNFHRIAFVQVLVKLHFHLLNFHEIL